MCSRRRLPRKRLGSGQNWEVHRGPRKDGAGREQPGHSLVRVHHLGVLLDLVVHLDQLLERLEAPAGVVTWSPDVVRTGGAGRASNAVALTPSRQPRLLRRRWAAERPWQAAALTGAGRSARGASPAAHHSPLPSSMVTTWLKPSMACLGSSSSSMPASGVWRCAGLVERLAPAHPEHRRLLPLLDGLC